MSKTKISRTRLEFAANCFLGEMRRRFVMAHPDTPNPVRSFSDYGETDRAAIMAAVEKAILATNPAADALYTNWQEKKQEKQGL